MTRRRMLGMGFMALLVAGVLLMMGHSLLSARARLRRVFDLPDASSEQAIQAALSGAFARGKSMAEVGDALEGRGLRRGGGSSRYYFCAEDGIARQGLEGATAIACVFDDNAGPIVFGEESYIVWFLFDGKQRLESVRVHRWVSDP